VCTVTQDDDVGAGLRHSRCGCVLGSLAGLSFLVCDGTVITSAWVRPSRFFV
jgi:hypothetical protein